MSAFMGGYWSLIDFIIYEKTDNEASGSREALAVTLIKYNLKKTKKTTVNTAILKIK